MKPLASRRAALLAIAVGGVVSSSGLLAFAAGLRVNVTPSVPLGLWHVHPVRSAARGDVVTLCPPDTPVARMARARGYFMDGSCPGSFMPLIKPVAAVAGDVVTISPAGVSINGQFQPGSALVPVDSHRRPLTPAFSGSEVVPVGSVFLLSTYNRKSFDSRYFGMVPVSSISSAGRPVMVTSWKPQGD